MHNVVKDVSRQKVYEDQQKQRAAGGVVSPKQSEDSPTAGCLGQEDGKPRSWWTQGCTFVFRTLEDPSFSLIARNISLTIMFLIVVSCVSYILATVPTFLVYKRGEDCKDPICDPASGNARGDTNNDGVCDKVECSYCETKICAPEPHWIFQMVEICSIIVFTAEYLARIFTTAFVPTAVLVELYGTETTDEDGEPRQPPTHLSPIRKVAWFMFTPMNLVDLAAIIPFYVEYMSGGGSGMGFIRVLRLARTFRIFKLGKYNEGMKLFSRTFAASSSALSLLGFFSIIGIVLFGSLIFFVEAGSFRVSEEFPKGEFMRPNVVGTEMEVSPYQSIPSAFYWVVVTTTTVGYGDQYPTSTFGRLIAIICMYVGVLAIALPITVLGSNFTREYAEINMQRELAALEAADKEEEQEQVRKIKPTIRSSITNLVKMVRSPSRARIHSDNENRDSPSSTRSQNGATSAWQSMQAMHSRHMFEAKEELRKIRVMLVTVSANMHKLDERLDIMEQSEAVLNKQAHEVQLPGGPAPPASMGTATKRVSVNSVVSNRGEEKDGLHVADHDGDDDDVMSFDDAGSPRDYEDNHGVIASDPMMRRGGDGPPGLHRQKSGRIPDLSLLQDPRLPPEKTSGTGSLELVCIPAQQSEPKKAPSIDRRGSKSSMGSEGSEAITTTRSRSASFNSLPTSQHEGDTSGASAAGAESSSQSGTDSSLNSARSTASNSCGSTDEDHHSQSRERECRSDTSGEKTQEEEEEDGEQGPDQDAHAGGASFVVPPAKSKAVKNTAIPPLVTSPPGGNSDGSDNKKQGPAVTSFGALLTKAALQSPDRVTSTAANLAAVAPAPQAQESADGVAGQRRRPPRSDSVSSMASTDEAKRKRRARLQNMGKSFRWDQPLARSVEAEQMHDPEHALRTLSVNVIDGIGLGKAMCPESRYHVVITCGERVITTEEVLGFGGQPQWEAMLSFHIPVSIQTGTATVQTLELQVFRDGECMGHATTPVARVDGKLSELCLRSTQSGSAVMGATITGPPLSAEAKAAIVAGNAKLPEMRRTVGRVRMRLEWTHGRSESHPFGTSLGRLLMKGRDYNDGSPICWRDPPSHVLLQKQRQAGADNGDASKDSADTSALIYSPRSAKLEWFVPRQVRSSRRRRGNSSSRRVSRRDRRGRDPSFSRTRSLDRGDRREPPLWETSRIDEELEQVDDESHFHHGGQFDDDHGHSEDTASDDDSGFGGGHRSPSSRQRGVRKRSSPFMSRSVDSTDNDGRLSQSPSRSRRHHHQHRRREPYLVASDGRGGGRHVHEDDIAEEEAGDSQAHSGSSQQQQQPQEHRRRKKSDLESFHPGGSFNLFGW